MLLVAIPVLSSYIVVSGATLSITCINLRIVIDVDSDTFDCVPEIRHWTN